MIDSLIFEALRKMKQRILTAALLMGTAFSLGAQDMYDAQKFSSDLYYGTARTVGMGNAVTAVGGDLGSITFNPAGSSVAGYSQISLTPGVSISSNGTVGSILTDGLSTPDGFGDNNVTRHPRMTLPSFGAVLNVDTHRSRGLVSYAFGITGNATNNFLGEVFGSGVNSRTSYLGYLAATSDGIASADLNQGDNSYYKGYAWQNVSAYQAGLIATYGGYTDKYAGATEFIDESQNIELAGDIDQRYGRLTFGNKYDIVFNWSGNINNVLYIGANFGITSLEYQFDDYLREQALSAQDFPIEFDDGAVRYFNAAKARYSYDADGAGIYAKFGFLTRLPGGLRLGATIQTPTVLSIKEHWSNDMSMNYVGESAIAAESPRGEYNYRLRTPWKFSAGVAWTLGESILLSADYELKDYKSMQFRTGYHNDDNFSDQNWAISQWMGVSHNLRLGAEVKPLPQVALRAGYNLLTSPEKDNDGKYLKRNVNSLSAGIGYSSQGSFFADLAVRAHLRGNNAISPYADPNFRVNGQQIHQDPQYCYGDYIDGVYSPEIRVLHDNLWDVLLTIGWRF